MATCKNVKQKFTLPASNLVLVGIVSSIKENKLVMFLNGGNLYNFYQADSILDQVAITNKPTFTYFLSEDEITESLFTLLVNRTPTGVFAKVFKEFDFLLQIEGDLADLQAQLFIDLLRRNSEILAVGVLPISKLKGQRICI